MSHIAKLFKNGRSQAVRLPAEYRFASTEVYILRDPETGNVILSRKPTTWGGFFAALKDADVPADFLAAVTSGRLPQSPSNYGPPHHPSDSRQSAAQAGLSNHGTPEDRRSNATSATIFQALMGTDEPDRIVFVRPLPSDALIAFVLRRSPVPVELAGRTRPARHRPSPTAAGPGPAR